VLVQLILPRKPFPTVSTLVALLSVVNKADMIVQMINAIQNGLANAAAENFAMFLLSVILSSLLGLEFRIAILADPGDVSQMIIADVKYIVSFDRELLITVLALVTISTELFIGSF